jgi:dipeptidyl aminopeptidase/acylaminoacyl peptidase
VQAGQAGGQEARTHIVDEVLRTLEAVQPYSYVAISPDASRVAWVERQFIRVADAASGQAAGIAEDEPGDKHELAWSPDSKQLAFLSDADSGQAQLYVADLAGGKARKLTDLKGYLSAPAWSPDGQSIAFLFIENSPRAAGPLQPMTPPAGVVEQIIYEQRLNVVDLASRQLRAISPADMYIYEYDWAPDSHSFVVTAAHGDGDNNWWIGQLYTLGLDGQAHSLYTPRLQIANPRYSPDGRNVAFIEGLMSDQGVVGGDVFLVPAAGGTAENLTPQMPASATWLAWSGPEEILFTELVDGNSGIAAAGSGSAPRLLWSGPELITTGDGEVGLSLARSGRQSAMVRSSALHPPEVWAGEAGAWKQVTHANSDIKPLWGEERSVHWNSDGFHVQGWLLLPRDYDARKKYPLIVQAHGGPASACTASWPGSNLAPLAGAGYAVLCPNPRGSYGQGEEFTRANVRDFGGGDYRDIVAGVDQVLRDYPIDPARLGIWGWSYGGYMTMWAETQTSRFGAAVAGAGLSDWLSYYGENDIDQWMIPYFGASVYDDPAVYAKSAPITFVKNVKTPTLILVGDRDGECPAPQSFEWWHALKTLQVPVEFVVYPGEGHQFRAPEHRRDVDLRVVRWFDRWLPPAGAHGMH